MLGISEHNQTSQSDFEDQSRHRGADIQWPSKLIAARQVILLGHAIRSGTVNKNERLS